MATQDLEDEFDRIPDDIDFAAIGDDEWNALQTQTQTPHSNFRPEPSQHQNVGTDRLLGTSQGDVYSNSRTFVAELPQGSSDPGTQPRRADTQSSAYFSDNDEDIDDAFLHQLDELENQILNRPSGTVSSVSIEPLENSRPAALLSDNIYASPRKSLKRQRQVSNEDLSTPSPKGKSKFDGDWKDLLSECEEEITCPVCFDVLAAAHLLNGCGHTLCGACAFGWIIEKHHDTCPVCRTRCHALTPMLPNVTVDNFVQKHLRMRAMLGDEGWKAGGSKLLEWQGRKE
ncbi:hypothetical protein GYMLUDRAFT_235664 [Collybiopsis luxurians FD-317 M1]|nr:hypothetical protein GYMLUDRAFT_235664 [Collybiopsis luxurians FD-317 M1]